MSPPPPPSTHTSKNPHSSREISIVDTDKYFIAGSRHHLVSTFHRHLEKCFRKFLATFLLLNIGNLFAQDYLNDTLIVQLTADAISNNTISIDTSGQHVLLGIPEIDSLDDYWGCVKITTLFPPPYVDTTSALAAGLNRFYLFVFQGRSIDSISDAYALRSSIKTCTPNFVTYASTVSSPNDHELGLGNQWEHTGTYGNLMTLGSNGAWAVTNGSSDIIIAVLDDGIDPNHEEFQYNIVTGFNVFDGSDNVSSDPEHGTVVTGLAAAEGNNTVGIAGVAWECRVMPVKVLRRVGTVIIGTSAGLAQGIYHAADNGASIINMSLGFSSCNPPKPDVEAALDYAYRRGVTSFSASGNDNLECVDYPARSAYCIAVGAMANCPPKGERKRATWDNHGASCDGQLYWGSNYGPELDFVAPGVGLTSTRAGGGYTAVEGTSTASPLAAGVAALMKSVNPDLSPDQVRNILRWSCTDIDTTGFDWATGYGKLNARAALELALNGNLIGLLNEVDGTTPRSFDRLNRVRFDSAPFKPSPDGKSYQNGEHPWIESWFNSFSLGSGRSQKFKNWDNEDTAYHIRKQISISGSATHKAIMRDVMPASITSVFYDGVLLWTPVVDSVQVKDPWRVSKNWQSQTQEQDYGFASHSPLPYTWTSDTLTYGVFLDQGGYLPDTTRPYYSVRMSSFQSWNGSDWDHCNFGLYSSPPAFPALREGDLVFTDWYEPSGKATFVNDPKETTYSNFHQYNTKAVILNAAGAEVTARYKPHMLSDKTIGVDHAIDDAPTGTNSQRKLDCDGSSLLHAAYEGDGEIFFTESTDDGVTWLPELRLSAGNGNASHVSIYSLYNMVLATWLENGLVRVGHVVPDSSSYLHPYKFVEYSYAIGISSNSDAAPVITGTACPELSVSDGLPARHTSLVVFETTNDNQLWYLWFNDSTLTNYGVIGNSTSGDERPSLAHDYETDGCESSVFHLAWRNGEHVYYEKVTVDLTQSPNALSFSEHEEISNLTSPTTGAVSITCSKGYDSDPHKTEAGIAYANGSDVYVWLKKQNQTTSPVSIFHTSDGDTVWSPSLCCKRRSEGGINQHGDNMRCAFNFSNGGAGPTIKVVQNNASVWDSSPTDQIDGGLYPSMVAFPVSGLERELFSLCGSTFSSGIATIRSLNTGIPKIARDQIDPKPAPAMNTELRCYPNPVTETATIHFRISNDSHIRIEVVDCLGRLNLIVVNEELKLGVYDIPFDSKMLPAGRYLCKFFDNTGTHAVPFSILK